MRIVELGTFEDPNNEVLLFRNSAQELDLCVLLDSTLRTLPGSVHLHLRKSGLRRGVLEYTMDCKSGRAWLSVQKGRDETWIEPVLQKLRHLHATK